MPSYVCMKAKYWPCKGVNAAVRDAPVLLFGELTVGPRVFDECQQHTPHRAARSPSPTTAFPLSGPTLGVARDTLATFVVGAPRLPTTNS